MLSSITDKGLENVFDFVIKVTNGRSLNLCVCKLIDKTGHKLEICKTSINNLFDEGVIRDCMVELLNRWKRERCPNVGSGTVVPKCNVCNNQFIPQSSIVRADCGKLKALQQSGELLSSGTQGLRSLGGAIIPRGCNLFGQSIEGSPIDRLQSLNLGFDGRKSNIYASFGIFSLSIEIDGLSKSNDCQNY